jgi:hypothetical protein
MTQDYKPSAGEHPITPPPKLVEQWDEEGTAMFRPEYQLHIATQAAQWGADQELEACCEWVINTRVYDMTPNSLRAARRPKPPSLKAQALDALENMERLPTSKDKLIIRRALEQLDD